MNRLYLIAPLVLLALFGGVYWQHNQAATAAAEVRAAETARTKEAEAAKKKEAERKAREDAEKRAAARLAEEEKREAEKHARWEEEGLKIAADTARFTRQTEQLTRESAELDTRLNALQSARSRLNRENFEIARAVETDQIEKRTAELELQRLTEMVARKAGNTSLVKP